MKNVIKDKSESMRELYLTESPDGTVNLRVRVDGIHYTLCRYIDDKAVHYPDTHKKVGLMVSNMCAVGPGEPE